MLKKIALVVGCIIALLLIVIATRPSSFRVTRSAEMAAPAGVVFGYVNDFHKWVSWSPWEKLDPGMSKTFSGPPAGTGAGYAWSGNDKVGEGRMTILDSRPGEQVTIKLEFIKPWTATNTTTFTLEPAGNATKVTWAMEGQNNFMAKAFSLFMNMDSMIGKDFENGLANMKGQAEGEAKRLAAAQTAAPAPPAPAPTAIP